MLRKILLVLGFILPLSACLSGKETGVQIKSPATSDKTQFIILTEGQERLYQEAVQSILPNKSSVKYTSVKTLKFETQDGYHTCGYAIYKNEAGQNSETPFYVELRKTDEKYGAHRGQVGTDDGKKAKVKFVCRHHKI
ncbi:MAG: hypothetical protein ACRBBJ_09355 [Rhodomicrobiaceae bacterium]